MSTKMKNTKKKTEKGLSLKLVILAGAGLLFAGNGFCMRAQADSIRDYRQKSEYYNNNDVSSSSGTQYGSNTKVTGKDFLNGLQQFAQTMQNLADGDATGKILKGSGGQQNREITYHPGSHADVDAGVSHFGGAAGSAVTRTGSVLSSTGALINNPNPGYHSETGMFLRNFTHAFNAGFNVAGPTISGVKPIVNTVFGWAPGKATEIMDSKGTINLVNNVTDKNPWLVKQLDRELRRMGANALYNQGYTDIEVRAYILYGEEEFQKEVNRRLAKELEDYRNRVRSKQYSDYLRSLHGFNVKVGKGNGMEKPNIYLYPAEETEVSVMFADPEKVTVSIPDYRDGWDVWAEPDGTLTDLSGLRKDVLAGKNGSTYEDDVNGTSDAGTEYGYLFYESISDGFVYQTEDGFFVPADNEGREEVYSRILTAYGLNEQEIADFVDYWVERLPEGKDYMMYPQLTEAVDAYMPVEITPTPDRIFRIWFVYESLEEEKAAGIALQIPEPEIPYFEREGFTVVEWGGVVH